MTPYEIKYIELKTGYSDNGPAWIGKVMKSKSGTTIYFNNKAFRKYNGVSGNYFDVESGEEYWISGVKKDGCDRHWSGKGKIVIDRKITNEYLAVTGMKELDTRHFAIADIEDCFPEDRIHHIENTKKSVK